MTAQTKNLGRIRPNPCGEYDSTRPYALMDIVSIGGESWMAKGDVPAGNSPAGIIDNGNWQHVLSRGDPDTYPVTADQTEDTRALREWAAQILANQQEVAEAVKKEGTAGAAIIPEGTTAERPVGNAKYFRYNTEEGTFEGFDGVEWGKVGGSSVEGFYDRQNYVATEGQTTFNVTYDAPFVEVIVNGYTLPPEDYTATSGTDVVINEGLPSGAEVSLIGLGGFDVADTYTKTQTDELVKSAVPLGSVQWWQNRSAVPAGWGVLDGQLIDRATFPNLWDQLQQPSWAHMLIDDATWQADPAQRGKFSTGDGSTTFRLPDLNGKSSGSYGAVFLRGDGSLSAGEAGVIQRDALQGHWHNLGTSDNPTYYGAQGKLYTSDNDGGIYRGDESDPLKAYATTAISDRTNGDPRTASETRPLNATGCFIIKLFGTLINPGSADAAQLASDYANLSSALQTFESRYDEEVDFAIIYPNGGTAESPADVSANSRYVDSNPFPGCQVFCVAEVLYNSKWGSAGWSNGYASEWLSRGVRAEQLAGDIVTQTGTNHVIQASNISGNPHGMTAYESMLPCRVKVWKVKGAIQ